MAFPLLSPTHALPLPLVPCLCALHYDFISVLPCLQVRAVSKTFYRRLVWRDLAYWQLHHW